MPRARGPQKGRGSQAGALGKKAPAITAEWGPVTVIAGKPLPEPVVPVRAKYAGTCSYCRRAIEVGDPAFWRPRSRAITCGDCGEAA
jgi:hypothetical protein